MCCSNNAVVVRKLAQHRGITLLYKVFRVSDGKLWSGYRHGVAYLPGVYHESNWKDFYNFPIDFPLRHRCVITHGIHVYNNFHNISKLNQHNDLRLIMVWCNSNDLMGGNQLTRVYKGIIIPEDLYSAALNPKRDWVDLAFTYPAGKWPSQ